MTGESSFAFFSGGGDSSFAFDAISSWESPDDLRFLPPLEVSFFPDFFFDDRETDLRRLRFESAPLASLAGLEPPLLGVFALSCLADFTSGGADSLSAGELLEDFFLSLDGDFDCPDFLAGGLGFVSFPSGVNSSCVDFLCVGECLGDVGFLAGDAFFGEFAFFLGDFAGEDLAFAGALAASFVFPSS